MRLRDARWLLPFVRPHWHLGGAAAALSVSSTVAALVLPITFKRLADSAGVLGSYASLNRSIAGVVAILLLMAVADCATQLLVVRFQQHVIQGLYRHLVRRLLHLPKAFFDVNRTGYLMSRAVGDVFELRMLFSLNVVNIVTKTLQVICALGMLLYLHWRLALLSMMVLPLFIALTQAFRGRLRQLNREVLESNALVSQGLEETLSAAAVIKAFASEEREADRAAATLRDALDASYRRTTIGAAYGLLSALVNAVGIGSVLWYGVSRIVARELTAGELLAFSAYLGLLIQPVQFLAGVSVTMQQALAAMERVLTLLKLIPEDDGDAGKLPIGRLDGRVTFEHVSFSYDGTHPALRDVSFAAGPGEVVAIVGPSGAGKSTLINLILCLYRADSGRILFDEVPADALQRHSLRERIGVVPQETFLFDDSIAANIRYGRPDVPDDRVSHAARQAGAEEFILALPRGFDTSVGEKGVRLSVGQKQRIAIARALLKDPDILILDEATSALDALTEHTFHAVLKELGQCKTVFVIAHRLSTALLSDSVLVLQEGRIVQHGTHDDLWRQGGLYRHLCSTQFAACSPVRAVNA